MEMFLNAVFDGGGLFQLRSIHISASSSISCACVGVYHLGHVFLCSVICVMKVAKSGQLMSCTSTVHAYLGRHCCL